MVECSKVNVKLSDTQLKKLKTAVKNKWFVTWIIIDNKKQNKEMLLITIYQLI